MELCLCNEVRDVNGIKLHGWRAFRRVQFQTGSLFFLLKLSATTTSSIYIAHIS
jgi:hypothetical protein